MASHGHSRHLKRLALSPLIPVSRKQVKFSKKASAGRHSKSNSMPILLLLRDVLHTAADKRETRLMLSAGQVKLDCRPCRDEAASVGLMDLVSIPLLKTTYVMAVYGGRLKPVPVAFETSTKLCKIIRKKIVRGGRIQLALHDGRSYLIEREEDRFSVGDTIKIQLPEQKLAGFLKLEKGARCYVHAGKHAGKLAVLEEVLERAGSAPSDVRLHDAGGSIITRKDYLLAVDDSFTPIPAKTDSAKATKK